MQAMQAKMGISKCWVLEVSRAPTVAGRSWSRSTTALPPAWPLIAGPSPNRVTLRLIRARKPARNVYVVTVNQMFGDECRTEHWFKSLAAAWRTPHAGHARQEAHTSGMVATEGSTN